MGVQEALLPGEGRYSSLSAGRLPPALPHTRVKRLFGSQCSGVAVEEGAWKDREECGDKSMQNWMFQLKTPR